MPLLRRQPFRPDKPSPQLQEDDEVFYCKITNEIFADYEQFFERIILCNSLVWSCAITNKSGMTYQEALECEEKAKKNLATFPKYLQLPILFLVSLTHRRSLGDLNDDIFVYAKDRFFIGEIVDVAIGNDRKSCTITRIIPPAPPKTNGDIIVIDCDSDSSEKAGTSGKSANFGTNPAKFQYVVQMLGKTGTIIVKASKVSRKRGLYTRDKSKLFLKYNCEPEDGIWQVKPEIVRKLNLSNAKFTDFFAGDMPSFIMSKAKKRGAAKTIHTSASESNVIYDRKKAKRREEKMKQKEMTVEEPAMEPRLTAEEKAILIEQMKQEKLAEKMAKREEIRKRMEEEKLRRKEEKAKVLAAEREERKKKLADERLKRQQDKSKSRAEEREKLREEKRLQMEVLREWNRQRDDLECDDLKLLPEFCPVTTRVPGELFGEAVMILEFVHIFKSTFDFKQFFPKGFTWGMLESALLDHDIDGPLCDLLQMMLLAIFNLQEEEAEEVEELELKKNDTSIEQLDETMEQDWSTNQMIHSATLMSQNPQIFHGMPLKEMLLDQFTLTEILRIHILASGARAGVKNARFRYQQRGGYTSLDDAGLALRYEDPSVLKALSSDNIFDLSPADKLKVINTLIQQIMSYAATRDVIEESYEKLRLLKYELKQFQWAEQRREREETQARYRKRMEERQREQERRLMKLQQREQQMKADENRSEHTNGDIPMKPLLVDGDRSTPSPSLIVVDDEMSAEEKEAIRKKEQEEEAKKKASFEKKEHEMILKILEYQRTNAIYPIGRDRMFRRYWVFYSLPGLFIEDNELFVPDEIINPVLQDPNSKTACKKETSIPVLTAAEENNTSTSSDKENQSLDTSKEANVLPENGETCVSANAQNSNVPDTNVPVNPRLEAVKKSDDDLIVISDSESDSQGMKDASKMEVDGAPPKLEVEDPLPVRDTEVSRQIRERPCAKWLFASDLDIVDKLLNSLNSRGFRESGLKQSLTEMRVVLSKSLKHCPTNELTLPPDAIEAARVKALSMTRGILGKKAAMGTVKNDSAEETLELNLRDTLLDLEDRIYAGALGLVKTDDRLLWRDTIEQGGYNPLTSDPVFARPNLNDKNGLDDNKATTVCTSEVVVKDLSRALLQIALGMDDRFLLLPLGEDAATKKAKQKAVLEAIKEKDKKMKAKREKDREEESEEEDKPELKTTKGSNKKILQRWSESLLSCSSLSQIFLHLATFEKSVAWAKSALHARCCICRRKGDAEKMLLCDGCDKGHHMYCLKPKLDKIPSGDWFCMNCRPKDVKRSPRKDRRRTFSQESSAEEEDSNAEAEDEEEDGSANSEDEVEESSSSSSGESSEDEEDAHDNTCTKCGKAGMLLCCDSCPGSYHLQCAEPILKKVPRGKWQCHMCLGLHKHGKIKIGKVPSKKKTPAKSSTPNSSRPGSRRESPRDSPVPTRPASRKHHHHSDDDTPRMKKNKSTSKLSQDSTSDMDGTPKYVSSFRGNSTVQQTKMLEEIIQDLIKHDDSWPFLKPVSKKDVPDYYKVIHKPMDFSTIRNKLHKYSYSDPASIVKDVRQIFINCIEYNNRKTPEYKCGGNLSKLFENRLKDVGSFDIPNATPPPSKKSKK